MGERRWCPKRAQAWVLRRAADDVLSGRHLDEVRLTDAMFSEPVDSEAGFRATLARVHGVEDAEVDQAVAWVYAEADGRPDALIKAIRAITVELPNDEPNGEAERQIDFLLAAIDGILPWAEQNESMRTRVGRISDAGAKLCLALADDTQKLRLAAKAYFGGDFEAPERGDTSRKEIR